MAVFFQRDMNHSPDTIVGTVRGKGSEVVETVPQRRIDLCCLQETSWKTDGVKQIVRKDSRFELFWSGNDKGTGELKFFWQRKCVRRCLRWFESQSFEWPKANWQ